jgi:hypothetical protein
MKLDRFIYYLSTIQERQIDSNTEKKQPRPTATTTTTTQPEKKSSIGSIGHYVFLLFSTVFFIADSLVAR